MGLAALTFVKGPASAPAPFQGAPYELNLYPDAEHGFDRNATRSGNTAAVNAKARTLAFLRTYVK